MKKQLYAAYGSNLCIEQMGYRCPTARIVDTTWLKDHKLVFQGHTYGAHANVIPSKGDSVPLAIWEVTPEDEKALDRYEGVKGGYYTREFVTVEVLGKKQKVLIYIMTPHDYGIPTDMYLGTIAQGYEDFGLPAAYLNEAVIHANENTNFNKGGRYAWL